MSDEVIAVPSFLKGSKYIPYLIIVAVIGYFIYEHFSKSSSSSTPPTPPPSPWYICDDANTNLINCTFGNASACKYNPFILSDSYHHQLSQKFYVSSLKSLASSSTYTILRYGGPSNDIIVTTSNTDTAGSVQYSLQYIQQVTTRFDTLYFLLMGSDGRYIQLTGDSLTFSPSVMTPNSGKWLVVNANPAYPNVLLTYMWNASTPTVAPVPINVNIPMWDGTQHLQVTASLASSPQASDLMLIPFSVPPAQDTCDVVCGALVYYCPGAGGSTAQCQQMQNACMQN